MSSATAATATAAPPPARPTVAIVSVNFNQTALTLEMLASVERAGLPAWCEVWVVDNASEVDGSPVLAEAYPWVRTLRSEENLGFAGGNNLAIRRTRAEFVFLLNNDALIDAGVLEGLVDRFRANAHAVARGGQPLGAVSPVIYDYPQRAGAPTIQYAGATAVSHLTGRNATLLRGEPAGRQGSGLQPVAYAHGAAMLVPRAVVEAVGSIDEDFFLYYEELDWCERIRAAGYAIALDADRAVWHRESVSTGGDSAFKTYWINRSRILFMRRNKPAWAALAFRAFYLLGVVPLHGARHVLAGRWAHARALVRAWTEQPRRARTGATDPGAAEASPRVTSEPALAGAALEA